MEVWQTIILALGGNAALLAVLGWLSKSLVSQLLAKDIEGFKVALQSESEAATQKLRHDLEKATIEHQVRFSKLHEQRAQVIAKLYKLLVEAHWKSSSFVSVIDWEGEPNKQEKYNIAMKSVGDFYQFFEKQRIYLPEELCEDINELIELMRKQAISFGAHVRFKDDAMSDEALTKKHIAWSDAWRYFDKEFPLAKAALENEFRSILGNTS